MKKHLYMIGNAHLDPVWMWRWQEGCTEAKATFRSALDRMKENPAFKFVCAAAGVYEWIGEICPEMLDEIKQRVAEGRWILAGGWWVQPDCNQPGGEAFARHALYSQRFFAEKFGATAGFGYNVDSFGHNLMIPQFLQKSGMTRYIYMRPMRHEQTMPANLFVWRAPDGSEVTAFRIPLGYCNNFQDAETMAAYIEKVCDEANPDVDATMVFYGVGNHGGGPTKQNIACVEQLRAEWKKDGVNVEFGDPRAFFDEVERHRERLPIFTDDLQHHASGCYSAVSAIKTANRRCENRLVAAEKFAVLSGALTGMTYPREEFTRGWKNTLFNQFHDSLGGCSIAPVYDDAAQLAGEALSIAARCENTALQRLSWAIGTDDGVYNAVCVFNPTARPVKTTVQCNASFARLTDENGQSLAVQAVRSDCQNCFGRPDTLFQTTVPALGWQVLRGYAGTPEPPAESAVTADENVLENENLRLTFDPFNGYIASLTDKRDGRELLDGPGAVPVVIDEHEHDTWSHGKNFFDKPIAQFSDAVLTVLENGPVRAAVKVVSRYNGSTLTQVFSLCAGSDRLTVRAEIDWHEKHKMCKLAFPTGLSAPRAFYEIPGGHIERPCDGEEECGLRWVAVKGLQGGMALLNDNKYSFSVHDAVLNLTVVRSPIYGDHTKPRDAESCFTDQGSHSFDYALLPTAADVGFGVITAAAEAFNNPPTVLLENNHPGRLPQRCEGLTCDAENVAVTALKAAEDGRGFVLRAVETDGKTADCTVELPFLAVKATLHFTPCEIKTLRIGDGAPREIPMTELE